MPGQVDMALLRAAYALEAKVEPHKDVLFIDNSVSPYAKHFYVCRDKAAPSASYIDCEHSAFFCAPQPTVNRPG